jgi:hypothetical protein
MVKIKESTLFLVLIRVDTQDATQGKERSLFHLSAIHVNFMRSKNLKKHTETANAKRKIITQVNG